jgi:REP element-mobilizing transposase RayT
MTMSRASQVSLETTPYYHCISRCVRRAFLCGDDRYSGENFDHRKEWLVERLHWLPTVFALEICAYAVMSNHFHLVLRIDRALAESWSDDEVLERYSRYREKAPAQLAALPKSLQAKQLAIWRERLSDLSWMMRSLNEWIARRANRDDGVTGHFWEGRFKSQALLDEVGLLTCMAYVDLNPVRAGLAKQLDEADFTSIELRLRQAAEATRQRPAADAEPQPQILAPFSDQVHTRAEKHRAIPMTFVDYVALLEWTGRAQRSDHKKGHLSRAAPPILHQLGIDPDRWLKTMTQHSLRQLAMLGKGEAMQEEAHRRGQAWAKGQREMRRLCPQAA